MWMHLAEHTFRLQTSYDVVESENVNEFQFHLLSLAESPISDWKESYKPHPYIHMFQYAQIKSVL